MIKRSDGSIRASSLEKPDLTREFFTGMWLGEPSPFEEAHKTGFLFELSRVRERILTLAVDFGERVESMRLDPRVAPLYAREKATTEGRATLASIDRIIEGVPSKWIGELRKLAKLLDSTVLPNAPAAPLAAEIRAHVRGLEATRRVQFVRAEGGVTLAAVLAVPAYLSGLDPEAIEILKRGRVDDDPDAFMTYLHIALLRDRLNELEKVVNAARGAIGHVAGIEVESKTLPSYTEAELPWVVNDAPDGRTVMEIGRKRGWIAGGASLIEAALSVAPASSGTIQNVPVSMADGAYAVAAQV